MKDTQINLNAMLTRIKNFGVAHAADFLATSKGGVLFATVASGVPKVGSAAAAQVSGGEAAKSGTDTKAVSFLWLHDDLMAISGTARTLAQTTPGLDDKFRLPTISPMATSCPSPALLPPMPRRFRPISSPAKCPPISSSN